MAFDVTQFAGPRTEDEFNRRVYRYRTTDNAATITGAQYFAGIGVGGANDFGAQLGDFIDVEILDDLGAPTSIVAYFLIIYAIDSDGDATASSQGVLSSLPAGLLSFSAVGSAANRYGYTTGANTWAEGTITAFGRSLLAAANAAAARTLLALGTIATQAANAIAITGGTIAGLTSLSVSADSIRITTSKTPSSASDTGTQGQIAWDADYIYVCTATDTWKRAAITTW